MAERLGWIGETRRAAVASWFGAHVGAWWSEWSARDTVQECLVDVAGGDVSTWRVLADDLAVGTVDAEALAGALTGFPTHEAAALARHLGEDAFDDLVQRLGLRTGLPTHDIEAADLGPALMDERRGAVRVVARIAGIPLVVRCARPLVDRVAPTPRVSAGALVARRSAIGETTVRLGATLDLGDIALSELTALRPGDVIATRASLDTSPSLTIGDADGPRIARARLGERDGRRALLLIPS